MSRRLLQSGIMEKPALYLKLWVWMLMQASHKDHGGLKRGQLFTSLERMRGAMEYKVGASLRKPTRKEIRSAVDFLSKGQAIGTAKGTHGMIITILNYDLYQDWHNYEGHSEGHSEGNRQGTILTKKGTKKEKNPPFDFSEIQNLKSRYPDQVLVDQTLQAIASTRKNQRIADTVTLSILQAWSRHPIEAVEAGLRTYLQKGYADQGKRESYLLGIIRGKATEIQRQPQPARPASTGSALLDAFYAANPS